MTRASNPWMIPRRDGDRRRAGPAILRWTVVSACAGLPITASAQETGDPAGDTLCEGPVISEIFVDNHTIYPPVPDSGQSANRIGRLANWVANRVHRRTRANLIRNELLFAEGDCLDPFLVEESGRILRALPFIADADVYPVVVSETEAHVVVDTRDKWTLKLDIRAEVDQRFQLTHVSITEENLMGTGTLLGAYLIERDERRDLGLELRTPRLFGTRMDGPDRDGQNPHGEVLSRIAHLPVRRRGGPLGIRRILLAPGGPVSLRGPRRIGLHACESPHSDPPRRDDAGTSFRYAR